MKAHRWRLVPVAAVAWIVAAVTTLVPSISPVVAVVAWLTAIGGLAALVRRPRPLLLAFVLAAVAGAVAASSVSYAQPARTAAVDLALGGGRAVEVTADVIGKVEHRASGELVFDALASRIAVGDETRDVRFDIQVRVAPGDVADATELDVGSRVRLSGTARAADPGKRAVLVVRASRGLEVLASPSGVVAVASGLRRGLVASVAGLPEPAAGLVPGLAVGDTSLVDPALDQAMKDASLSHLTAVSGANCALVVGIAFAAAAIAGARRGMRVLAGLAVLGGFVVLVTPEPSVARAAAMAAIAMLAVALGRPAAGIAVLSLAMAVLLMTDPWLSTSLGFALSAAATAALLVLARPLARGLERWMPRALALAFAVPLAAQLACGPLLVLIAPTVPVYGVVANLLAAPAAPLATVLGLAACLALPLPLLQSGLAALTWLPAAWIAGTAGTFAHLPNGQLPWLEGAVGAALLALLGAAVFLTVAVARSRWPHRIRAVAIMLVAAATGVAAGGAALTSVAGPLTLPREWSILACDIGQGDAVLVRSAGRVALIDTGPDPAALTGCLDRAGIARLDILVLTHFDADHAGGADAVVGRVDRLLHGPPTEVDHELLLQSFADAGAVVDRAHAGERGVLGDASWRVVWPRERSVAFPGGNDASVVWDIEGGGVPHTLFLGDLSASPQRAIAASRTLVGPYDVVKVAHHGSADQAPELYEAADAAVALISVGLGNDYGHPRAETLDLVTGLGAVVVRTDRDGMVALWRDGAGVRVWHDGRVGGPG